MKKTVFLCIVACFTALLAFGCALRSDNGSAVPDVTTEPHVHSFETEIIPPTCSMNGETVYTCECGHSYTKKGEDAKGHDYGTEVIAPTCTVQGVTKYTCRVCGHSFSEDHVAPVGHNYVEVRTVAPTSGAQGYTVYQCTNCDLSYNDDFVGQLQQETTPPPPPVTDAKGFDGCVFLGDSISDMLEIHNARTGIFGNATFLTETSYSLYNCVKNNYGVTYNGQRMAPEDAIAASGKKKVFIMLGTNDLVWASVDSTVANYKTLISRIKAKVPDAEIYITSQTPIYTAKESQSGGLSNVKINEYNEKLRDLCDSYGYAFVDVATPLKEQSGGLSEKYTTDKYVHINAAACEVWQAVVGKHLGL